MHHFLKIKRKKSPELPQQPISPGSSAHIAAGPSNVPTNLATLLEDERNSADSRLAFQDRMDEDQVLSSSEAGRPAFATVPDDVHHTDGRAIGGTSNTERRETDPVEVSRFGKRARRSTLLGGLNEATEKFGPLKVTLASILAAHANREGIVALGNKVGVLLPRIAALEDHFDSRPSDVAEQRRRDELIHQLRRFGEQLRSWSEEQESQGLTDHIQGDGGAFGPLEDMQEAILKYQMALRTTVHNQAFNHIDSAEALAINNFRCAQGAEYRHGNRIGCLKGTRRAILDGIELWAHDFAKPPVYWLNGLAGTGKTTIAQTVAERTFADGWLGASFFCSRGFEDRSNLQLIFPTLAVQLARTYPEFRSIFVPLAQSDPAVAHESLCGQMNKLIVQPLVKSSVSTVIVIDALDECKDDEPASVILSVLGQFVAVIPKVKFFITGRPEPRIRTGFRLPLLADATNVFVLHDVEQSQVNSDIRLFFEHNFSQIRSRHPGLVDWPTKEQLDQLCERAAGLFVYAMATIRCTDRTSRDPETQLDRLLQSVESKMQGKTKLRTNTTLDSLYMTILNEAFGEDNPEDYPSVRSVLGALILAANPLSPSAIATLLGFKPRDVSSILSSMHSLLVLQEDIDHPVRPFHKSFADFLIDPDRCTDSRFRVSPPDQNTEILVGCLGLMNRKLEYNMCRLPDRVTNADVTDLKERTAQYVDKALQYACRSWHKHVVEVTTTRTPDITPALGRFLEEKFIFWLEVLSVLGSAREAVDALETSVRWAAASSTLDTINDYTRFVITFFEVINTSAPHIYHSALPLSPRTSIIHDRYKQYARPLARVIWGAPASWEQSVATMYGDEVVNAVAWSPCNRFAAVARLESNIVQLLDAATLGLLDVFQLASCWPSDRPLLNFSPDSRSLALCISGRITTWDLQTGGTAASFLAEDDDGISSTYSMDGRFFAVLSKHRIFNDPLYLTAYDLLRGTRTDTFHALTGRVAPPIWTHGGCIRFVTVEYRTITISEVGFASTHTPVGVESFPAPERIARARDYLFLPALSRIAFILPEATEVWDAQHSRTLLECTGTGASMMSFSADGRLFAYVAMWFRETHVWKESATGYELHQRLPCASLVVENFVLSPNGRSIITTSQSIYLWSTAGPTLSLPNISMQSARRDSFVLALSPDQSLAAIARKLGNIITVVNLTSGDCRLVIETGMGIDAVGVTVSTLIAVGDDKVVAWTMPVGDHVFNAQTNINDSVRTTILDQPGLSARDLSSSASISPGRNRIAVTEGRKGSGYLRVYDISTGKYLGGIETREVGAPWFTPDGCEVWVVNPISLERWAIVENEGSGLIEMEPLESTACPPGVSPWRSSRGHYVHDGWMLNSARERILWLPHRWRFEVMEGGWGGRFLGLLHWQLPEAVVLEPCD